MEVSLVTSVEGTFENLRTFAPALPTTGASLVANGQFLAYLDTTGSGACLGVLPLSSYGKNHIPVSAAAYQQPILRAHSQIVQDMAFSPFNPNVLFTCSADKAFKIWSIPAGGMVVDIVAPQSTLTLSSNNALFGLAPHLSAELVAVRSSKEIGVFDMTAVKQVLSFGEDVFAADMSSLTWAFGGHSLVSTSKDKTVRLWDPRAKAVTASAPSHQSLRFGASEWLGDSPFFVTGGASSTQERELWLWDHRNMASGPVQKESLDKGTGGLFLNYDPDTSLLLLSGRADVSMRGYRFADGALKHACEGIVSSNAHMKDTVHGLAFLPKSCAQRGTGELVRMLKLSEGVVQTIAVTDTAEAVAAVATTYWGAPAALSADLWLSGESQPPISVALPPVIAELAEGSPISPSPNDSGSRDISPNPSSRASARLSSLTSVFRCKHLYGNQNKREFTAFNLTPDLSALDNPIIAANEKMWALPYRSGGGGGPILLSALDTYGRVPHDCTILNGHKTAVQDLCFSPFHSHLLATGATDSSIKLWDVGTLFDAKNTLDREACNAAEALVSLNASSCVRSLLFHPTVDRLLVSNANDQSIRFHDLVNAVDVATFSMQNPDSNGDGTIANMSFSFDGSLLAVASKDRLVRILDPRGAKGIVGQTGSDKNMGRSLRVLWCGRSSNTDPLVTVSAGSGGLRQIALWDARSLAAPVTSKAIDNGSGQLFPMFDEGLNVVYVVGKGDTMLRAYEIASLQAGDGGGMLMDKVMEFPTGMDPIAGMCMLPKRACDVANVEVSRLIKLTTDSVTAMSFRVPRADHLKAFFQDDLYPPTRSAICTANVDDWMSPDTPAEAFAPVMQSLQPEGMSRASDRPPEPVPSQSNSKINSFRLSIQKKEEEDKQRESAFAKLQKLAEQNAGYHVNLSGGKDRKIGGQLVQKAVVVEEEDSDDGW